jgi:hypothetical protein
VIDNISFIWQTASPLKSENVERLGESLSIFYFSDVLRCLTSEYFRNL